MYKKEDELRAFALVKEVHSLYAKLEPCLPYHNEDSDKELFDMRVAAKVVRGDHDAVNDILSVMAGGFKDNPDRRKEYQRTIKLQEELLSFSRGKTAEETVTGCLESRLSWYKKAVAIAKREIPYENGFDWPPEETDNPLSEWTGAIRELQNTIDMLKHYKMPETRKTVYVLIEYNDTAVMSCETYELYLSARLAMGTAYHSALTALDESEYMGESTFIEDERACISAYDADLSCCWEICGTQVYNPEDAGILLEYNQYQAEWRDKLDAVDMQGLVFCENVRRPGGFNVLATYASSCRHMWFSAKKDDQLDPNHIEALKWCRSQGIRPVSSLKQAERILREIDENAEFKHDQF